VWLPDLSPKVLAALGSEITNPLPYNLEKYEKLARENGTSFREEALLLENQ
jgi:hypothetical protein